MKSDYEARMQSLEVKIGNVLARLLNIESRIGQALAGLQQVRAAGGGFGGYSNLTLAYTPALGIPYATKAGSPSVLTQFSAMCYPGTDNGSGSWTASTTASLLVYNPFTSSTSTNAGVGGAWVLVGTTPAGDTEMLGDPC